MDNLTAQPEVAKDTNVPSTDCISRQAAIDAIRKDMYADKDWMSAVICDGIEQVLMQLPSAQPDLSSYSDKLWRAAYERGKAEGQRKTGKWWRVAYAQEYKYQCDQCGRFHRAMYDYCPSCGADMREGEQDDS